MLTKVAQNLRILAKSKDLSGLIQKYMDFLKLETTPIIKIQNSLGAKNLGTCKWTPGQSTSTIVIQKTVLGDPNTLERVLAHEMAHHAVFLENIKDLQDLAAKYGLDAGPYINRHLQQLRREDGHGEPWLKHVKAINSHMGTDFVTLTSDQSYVQDAETKPYFVLIAALPNGKYGFQIGVTLSIKMKKTIEYMGQHYNAKLVRTTDPRWQHGPRIGGTNWATSADKQDEMKRLHSEN